ncbi:dynein associated protein-domain-containing protein [Syncephalastrum racemosum]|uniref:Dynein associated protein-domain-containing protein n=1 Tax=Syncephalastrum racemosum TaxID=13706 RepID=A0A1X2HUW3_SYNRA|nr:dynein associated protein-domain-containing protein [Syncephalastrum racemosum]
MRLRDATTEHEAELNRRIKSLEKDNYELEDFKIQYEKVKEELDSADLQIEDLKQRLDDAMGAEDLVDQLTEKNLSLTEKIEELRAAVEDLEALKELADELEDNHMETEKQLQAEIDHRDMLLREQLERLRSSEETNADYEATIQQFRELVMNLQNDLEQLRHKEESQKTERQSLSSQSQAMMSLNMQLQSTVMKAQAKAIDLELRKLEAAQANDRLNYIQPYLPDSFFKTENDPISCLLLFKRLVFKSEIIIKHLDQKHPVSEKIMDTVDENLVAVCELRQRAGWLGDLAKRFVTFIKHCRPEVFIRMGQVFHDLVGTERRLNGIVELLRTDELNETECIMDLQRMMAQLEHLTEVYLVQNGETILVDQFFGLTRALDFNADRMTVELTYIKQAVQNAVKENIVVTEGQERLDMDYYEPLKRLVSDAKNSKIMAKKILRQLEDLSEQALMLKSEHLHRFKTLHAISSKLSQFCYESYREISAYVEAKRGSKEEISLNVIQKIVYNKADEILEIAESTLWEGCIKTLRSLSNELNATITRIDNDNKMDKIAASTAPWIQRASDMKAEVVVSHDMERKLQQHSDEILKLIKDIKIKDQALQESNVKVELLEKRMIAAKKQADQIGALEDTLQKTQAQEHMYAEALDNLQAEYDALQQEMVELKKRAAVSQEEQRQNVPKKPEVVSEVPKETDSNIVAIMQQLESLKAVIRFLRAENAHMKYKDLCYSLGLGETLLAPEKPADPKRDAVRSMAVESRALVKEMRAASASPKLVVLDGRRRGGKWQSRKKAPDYTYQTQQTVLHTLRQRSAALRDRAEHLRPATKPHVHLPSPSSEEAQKQSPSLASNVLSRSLAKIQIPAALSSPKRCHRIQLQSAAEFERIHALFIR